MTSTVANVINGDLWSPQYDICLTEGQHRTLCVSNQLPACLRPPGNEWSVDQFDLLTELYHGKISLLHQAVHKASGVLLAIKQYKKKYLTALARYQIEREVRIHISLQHAHIIKLLAVFEDPDLVYLVQELAPGGDLFEALKRQPSMMYDEQEAVGRYMEPCLQALAYMQERRIIHRDIKPENILLGEGGAVKLADFGLAINQEQERPVTRAGTLDYMAPEVLVCPDKKHPEENKDKASLGYDEQVDAWAIGCLAAELITGSPPFESESRSATYQLIMYREPKLPARLSKEAKNFVTASLNKNAKERATVEQLLQHVWITSNAQAFRQQMAASEEAAHVAQQGVAAFDELATPAPTVTTTQGQPGGQNNSSSTLASQQPAADAVACSRSGSSAWTPGSKAASIPAAAADGPAAAPSTDVMISAAAGSLEGLQTPLASSCVAADVAAAEATTACNCVPREHVDSSTVLPTHAADLQAAQASEQATRLAAKPEAQQPCTKGLAPLPDGRTAATLADDVSVAAMDTVSSTAPAAKLLLPVVEAAPVTTPSALPAAAATAAAAPPDSAADASEAQGGDACADGASSSSGSTIKARLARASSHHGHRLHKLFYPHDRHRRSSYNNCNTQWDDFIDTSAHSFTGNSVAMLLADSIVGTAGDSAAAGVSCMVAASRATSCSYGAAGLQQGLCSSGSSFVSVPPESPGIAAGTEAGSCSASSSTNSSNTARESLLHQAGLAALPDAGLQAPASVVEQLLSTAASGALHLLAANDLEDLIALNPAPGSALTSLGLVETSGRRPGSAHTCHNSCCSTHGSCSRAAATRASTRSKDGTASYPAAGAILKTLNDSNLDDFIATSASPGGSRVNRVSVLVSRSASAANLSAQAAPATQSPLPSPKSMSAAVTAPTGISTSSMTAADSPRTNRVKSAAATAACRVPDAPAGSYCALQPRPPTVDRSSPAPNSSQVPDMGSGSWSAAPTPCGAASSIATSVKPLVRPKSAMCGTLVIPNGDTVAAGACTQGESLQHASCSLPPGCQLGQSVTPTGGSRKSVVWADSAAAAAAPCVDSMPRASMSPRPAAAAGSGMQRSASCAAICDPSSSSWGSPRLQPAWHSGFKQQDGSSSSSSRKQSSMQPSLPHPQQQQQQQQGGGEPLPGANYYCPPTGVLSSGVGLACPAKGQLGSKAMPALSAGYTPHRYTSCPPAGLQAAADTLEPVQGASSLTAAGGTVGTAAGGTRTSRAAELCSDSLAGDAAAALGNDSGVFDAAVPFAAVNGMSVKGSTSLTQPGRVSSNQDEFTQSSSEQCRSVRRYSSTVGNATVPRVTKAYRRCRRSSSGSDDCGMTTLRQPAKSFTAGFGAAPLAGAGATAARSSSRPGMRSRSSSSDTECELGDALAARQQRQLFPGKGRAAVELEGVCGAGNTACTRSRGALTPTKFGACVPGGKACLQKLRSKFMAESGVSAWPH